MTEQPATPQQPPMTYDQYLAAQSREFRSPGWQEPPTGPGAPKPAQPKRKDHKAFKAVGVLAVFVVGLFMGGAGAHGTTTTVTPASCSKALDQAEYAMHAAADGYIAEGAAWEAASRFDWPAVSAQKPALDSAASKVRTAIPLYNQAAADCRANK